MLFNGNVFGNVDWNYNHQKPETNPETWFVIENFFLRMKCHIQLERSWKVLFNGSLFRNVGWKCFHQKTQKLTSNSFTAKMFTKKSCLFFILYMNNPETYVLKQNSFKRHLVYTFTDGKKALILKNPNRATVFHEIIKLLFINFLIVFFAKEDEEIISTFETKEKEYLFVEKVFFQSILWKPTIRFWNMKLLLGLVMWNFFLLVDKINIFYMF